MNTDKDEAQRAKDAALGANLRKLVVAGKQPEIYRYRDGNVTVATIDGDHFGTLDAALAEAVAKLDG